MIELNIPGTENISIEHLVLDFNGTVALDGLLLSGVRDRLKILAENLRVHVLTADTFGQAQAQLNGIDCLFFLIEPGSQEKRKQEYVKELGADRTIAIGNGKNDCLMIRDAKIGIAVILAEGAASVTVQSADVICTDINRALDLIIHPLRLTATLRS